MESAALRQECIEKILRLPICQCNQKASLQILTPHPIIPSEEEINANSRSRSAKLRAVERI